MHTVFATAAFATAFSGGAVARDEREDMNGAEDRRRDSWITKTGG